MALSQKEKLQAVSRAIDEGYISSAAIEGRTGINERTVRRYLAEMKANDTYTVEGVTPDDLAEDPFETMDQLLKRQEHHDALADKQNNQYVRIETEKPISVTLFSDIHWGNRDVDYKALIDDTIKVRDTEGAYAFCLGDLGDNWVGKLEGIANRQEISIHQEKSAIEWWLNQLSDKLPVVVSGNHDNRSDYIAHIDYVKEMCRGMNLLYGTDEVKFKLQVGDGEWQWKCRHSFKGNSQWNETHAMERDGKMYDGWDFGAAGHFHRPTVIRPYFQQFFRKHCYACNIGTYKKRDDFATRIGLGHNHTEYTATIYFYPSGKVGIAQGFTLEESLKVLTDIRKRF